MSEQLMKYLDEEYGVKKEENVTKSMLVDTFEYIGVMIDDGIADDEEIEICEEIRGILYRGRKQTWSAKIIIIN